MSRLRPLACLCLLVPFACSEPGVGDDLPPGAFTSGPGNGSATDTDSTSSGSGSGSDGSTTATVEATMDSGSSSTGIVGPISHDVYILPIWIESCSSNTACHDADAPAAGVDLASEGVYTRICENAHGFTGMPFIDCAGGDPQNSYMFRKLENSHMDGINGNGGIMPPTGMLSESTLNLIETWITEGALM